MYERFFIDISLFRDARAEGVEDALGRLRRQVTRAFPKQRRTSLKKVEVFWKNNIILKYLKIPRQIIYFKTSETLGILVTVPAMSVRRIKNFNANNDM